MRPDGAFSADELIADGNPVIPPEEPEERDRDSRSSEGPSSNSDRASSFPETTPRVESAGHFLLVGPGDAQILSSWPVGKIRLFLAGRDLLRGRPRRVSDAEFARESRNSESKVREYLVEFLREEFWFEDWRNNAYELT